MMFKGFMACFFGIFFSIVSFGTERECAPLLSGIQPPIESLLEDEGQMNEMNAIMLGGPNQWKRSPTRFFEILILQGTIMSVNKGHLAAMGARPTEKLTKFINSGVAFTSKLSASSLEKFTNEISAFTVSALSADLIDKKQMKTLFATLNKIKSRSSLTDSQKASVLLALISLDQTLNQSSTASTVDRWVQTVSEIAKLEPNSVPDSLKLQRYSTSMNPNVLYHLALMNTITAVGNRQQNPKSIYPLVESLLSLSNTLSFSVGELDYQGDMMKGFASGLAQFSDFIRANQSELPPGTMAKFQGAIENFLPPNLVAAIDLRRSSGTSFISIESIVKRIEDMPSSEARAEAYFAIYKNASMRDMGTSQIADSLFGQGFALSPEDIDVAKEDFLRRAFDADPSNLTIKIQYLIIQLNDETTASEGFASLTEMLLDVSMRILAISFQVGPENVNAFDFAKALGPYEKLNMSNLLQLIYFFNLGEQELLSRILSSQFDTMELPEGINVEPIKQAFVEDKLIFLPMLMGLFKIYMSAKADNDYGYSLYAANFLRVEQSFTKEFEVMADILLELGILQKYSQFIQINQVN